MHADRQRGMRKNVREGSAVMIAREVNMGNIGRELPREA